MKYNYHQKKKIKLDQEMENYFVNNQFEDYLKNNLMEYGHLFLGTNDFETDFMSLNEQIQKFEDFQKSEKVAMVSNGWIFVFNSLIQINKNIKQIIFYDNNPIMLMIYDVVVQLFLISENRSDFIRNLYCRNLNNFDLLDNQSQLEYLKQPYDQNIYIEVQKKLQGISLKTYKTLFFKYAIESSEKRNVYPTYYFDPSKSKEMNLIDNKKMHTTQQIKNIYHYFTSFYYNILEPFQTDQQFFYFKQRLNECSLRYSYKNIYDLFDNNSYLDYHQNLILYIDGIDDEYCVYLKSERDQLFKKIQKDIDEDCKIYILSTKSGITQIDKKNIIKDHIEIKPYKRTKQNTIEKFQYYKQPEEYIQQLKRDFLKIEQCKQQDFYELKKILQDEVVMKYVGNGQIENEKNIKNWLIDCEEDNKLLDQDRNYFNYSLYINNKIKGLFRLSKQKLGDDKQKKFYIRIILKKDNQGYATQFLQKLCIPELKKKKIFDKIYWACKSTYSQSIKVAQKIGGQFINTQQIFGQDYSIYEIKL